jgi:hypothetical protein
MSAGQASVLPPEIQREFGGWDAGPAEGDAGLARGDTGPAGGTAYLLITADEDGAPRPCMLSAGEILAVGEHTLRIAVWPDSTTAANLRAGSRAVLCYVKPGTVRYVKGHALRTREGELLVAEVAVDEVTADDHPGFAVTSGIRFTYEGKPAELAAAWSAQLALLRGAP